MFCSFFDGETPFDGGTPPLHPDGGTPPLQPDGGTPPPHLDGETPSLQNNIP